MINKFIAYFIVKLCISQLSIMKMIDKVFLSWIKHTPECNKKEKIIGFINLVASIIQEHMPTYNVALSEIRLEVISILNNNNASEPRMMCPRCKALVKIPRQGEKRTLSWTHVNANTRGLTFDCPKCRYTKPLGITTNY